MADKAKHPEILLVPDTVHNVSCNGGGGALGHPRVYYTFDGGDEVVCGYCDRLFTHAPHPGSKPYKDAA